MERSVIRERPIPDCASLHPGYVSLNRRTLRLGAAQMLIEPRHDLDEIARPVTIIELVHQNVVPGVAAGARRARQAEDAGRAGDARSSAGLDRRSTRLALAHHQKQRRESVHALFE